MLYSIGKYLYANPACDRFNKIIWRILATIEPLLRAGGRVACYCPTTIQLEKSWESAQKQGLVVEWAGEMIERKWVKASKGGVRPGNQPMGHTAFLLIAAKIAPHEEE